MSGGPEARDIRARNARAYPVVRLPGPTRLLRLDQLYHGVTMNADHMPDDTPIESVLFSPRIQNALRAAEVKTVGEVREMSDETLISLPDFGRGSLSDLRGKLSLPSTDGVRPIGKKPT